jgi:hypothetical protein
MTLSGQGPLSGRTRVLRRPLLQIEAIKRKSQDFGEYGPGLSGIHDPSRDGMAKCESGGLCRPSRRFINSCRCDVDRHNWARLAFPAGVSVLLDDLTKSVPHPVCVQTRFVRSSSPQQLTRTSSVGLPANASPYLWPPPTRAKNNPHLEIGRALWYCTDGYKPFFDNSIPIACRRLSRVRQTSRCAPSRSHSVHFVPCLPNIIGTLGRHGRLAFSRHF